MHDLIYQATTIAACQIIRGACKAVENGDMRKAERDLADAIAVLQRLQKMQEATPA